jgi:hypothetical protein
MRHNDRRWARKARVFGIGALLLAGAVLIPITTTGAVGQPGDVKIHDITQATSDSFDNPKPCDTVLVSFNFAVNSQYTYEFFTQPGGVIVIPATTVTVTTDPQQQPPSGSLNPPLVSGAQYKLVWDFGSSIGNGPKSKVFQVSCGATSPTTSGTSAGSAASQIPSASAPSAVTATPRTTG